MFGPVVPSSGPTPCSVCILAEAPGTQESEALRPLVGPSGWELRKMLRTLGADLDSIRKVNVFGRQPDGNNLALYGVPKGCGGLEHLGPFSLNPITFLHPDHLPDVQRALDELAQAEPNVIIALGNTATWALGFGLGINNLRGTVHITHALSRPTKVVPTYHPAFILRQWSLRSIAVADLQKALNEASTPDVHFDNTTLWLEPTLDDLAEFDAVHIQPSRLAACDIETKRGQITCISFAPSVDHSLCIPFWIEGSNPNYWQSYAEERAAWGYVKRWLENPDLTIVGQNFLYDLMYLTAMGIRPRGCHEDTMIAHHSLWSELPKGLGQIAASHANVPSWKRMRLGAVAEILKRDD